MEGGYDYFAGLLDNEPHDVAAAHRQRINHQIHERWRLRDVIDPLGMSVPEFMGLFRMPQHEVVGLLNIIRPHVVQRHSPQHTPLMTKLLTALSYYAGGTYQRMLGRSADTSLSQTSISRYIKEITDVLNHPAILQAYIRFPMTHAERAAAMERNNELGMPRCLGYVDGSLKRITNPPRHEQAHAYLCRKGWPAINFQIVCDAHLKILNVNARFPGSCNDQAIWNASGLPEVMQQAYFEDRCWLLGDSGYTNAPWLHIPLPHAEVGTPEYDYTQLHCYCRNAIERAIGVLKARWRCLSTDRVFMYRPTRCGYMVNACCVLHNYCVNRGMQHPLPIIEVNNVELAHEDDLPAPLYQRGLAERQYLINYAHARKQQRMELYGF